MMIRNKLILLVVLILLAVGIYYLTDGKVLMQAPVVEENSNSNTEELTETTPEPIVAENPEGEADPEVMKLDMKTWQWVSVLYNDGTEVTPKNPSQFGLIFKNDGTFSASTDCNSVSGKYTVNGNQIEFTDMMSTLMFCTESQETDFIRILENTSSFFFTSKGELIFDIKFDSGSATFR